MKTIDDFLGGFKAPQVVVPICARADLMADYERLQEELQKALRDNSQSLAGANGQAVREKIYELEDEMEANTMEFVLQALPSNEYRRILAENPPRKEDEADKVAFNRDTFPAALLAECCVQPEMSYEQALEVLLKISDGQFAKLWNSLLLVNVGEDKTPKSARPFKLAGSSGKSSSIVSPEESPDQSSLAGS